jgi:type VI secretion system protein ImpF
MAKRELERTVQPSVLDRLTDDDPRVQTDRHVSYADSLRAFKAAIQRDLEWLLNTRRTPTPAPAGFTELRTSLFHYGVPDITSISRDSSDAHDALLKHVDDALAMFEPRLMNVRISTVDQEGEAHRRELRFVVEATMRLDPTPEQVRFDTVLHFSTGEIDVAGGANA